MLGAGWRDVKIDNWELKNQGEEINAFARRILSLWMKLCYDRKAVCAYSQLFRLDRFIAKKCCDIDSSGQPQLFLQIPAMQKKSAFSLHELGLRLPDLAQC